MQAHLTVNTGTYSTLLHSVFEFLGIFIAYQYYRYLRKKEGDHIPDQRRIFVIIGAALGAAAGARVIGSLEDIPGWLCAKDPWLYFFTNKTLVGGLMGGLVGVESIKKIIGEKQNTGDLFTFPVIAGMIIGRIGCFLAALNEQTYGKPSALPWAIDLGDGIPRHPVTLYEILFLSLLFIALQLLKRHYILHNGSLFKMSMVAYLLFRLSLDIIKPGWRFFLGLGTIQLTCIAGLVYYAPFIVHRRSLIVSKKINAS